MSDQTRKLGYLVPQFPGQTHIFFWREIQALEALGIEVTLFSTRPPPAGLIAHAWSDAAMARTIYLGRANPLASLGRLHKLPWAEIASATRKDGVAALRDALIATPAAHALAAHCKAHGIDHVHVHSCGRAALVARLARDLGGPRYSLTLHGPLSDYGPAQVMKWQAARFATIITQRLLGEMQTALGSDLPQRLIVRPMGVDTQHFQREAPYQTAQPGAPLRIFSCGRLNVVKGHQDLLKAIRILLDRGVDVRLEIAGEDDDGGSGFRAELEATIGKLRLQSHAKLLGAIDAGEVKTKLLAAHVFALASWHEPLGVAYMEAMSCGLPTIGTDAGGVRELISDGKDGLLVPPKSPERLADAIASLAADPGTATRLAEAARHTIVENFRAEHGAEVLVAEAFSDRV